MEIIRSIFLVIHVIAGMSALFSGLFAMITKKGLRNHIVSGNTFFWSMILVSFSALILSLIIESTFLFCIGIFAYFMTHFGKRVVNNKRLNPDLSDWIILIVAIINSIFMILTFSIVLSVFGVISLLLSIDLFKLFYKKKKGMSIKSKEWLRQHIGLMIGSYISTLTAFLVVNLGAMPFNWIIWLLPTVIFTPLIAYWQRKISFKVDKKVSIIKN